MHTKQKYILSSLDYHKPTVVFDIDSVLATPVYSADSFDRLKERVTDPLTEEEMAPYHLEAAGYTHMVFWGSYALLRALRSRGVQIVFFSSGVRGRNEELIPKIYAQAFPKDTEAALKETIIYSREHCVDAEHLRRFSEDASLEAKGILPSVRARSCYWGCYKKDLRILLLDPNHATGWDLLEFKPSKKASKALENMALLEDDPSYMAGNQEKNMVYLSGGFDSPYFFSRALLDPSKNEDPTRLYRQQLVFYHFFFAYYLIDKALEMVNKQKIPFRDAMHKMVMGFQDSSFNDPDFRYRISDELAYYQYGLEKLKPYWPGLDFIHA